jgi:hypothetical protein
MTPAGNEVFTGTLELEHLLPDGGWVAARCWGPAKSGLYSHVPTFAHTSPVWVEVAGRPIPRAAPALAALVREVDGVREWVDANGRFSNPRRKAHLLALCDAAAAQLAGPT